MIPVVDGRSLGKVLGTALLLGGVAGALLLTRDYTIRIVFVAALLIPAERLFALHKRPILREGWRTDLAHFVVDPLVVTVGVAVPLALARLLIVDTDAATSLRAAVATHPREVRLLEAFVIVALFDYVAHRLSHQVPLLWRFHALHHSPEQLDWLVTARNHPINSAVVITFFVIPLEVLGLTPVVNGPFLAVFLLAIAFIEHANLSIRVPRGLRWVVPSPEFHHWHHARDVHCNYSNYPFVDALFRTAHHPVRERPASYGVADPYPPSGYFAQLFFPFRRRTDTPVIARSAPAQAARALQIQPRT